jgi:hypothetical protein
MGYPEDDVKFGRAGKARDTRAGLDWTTMLPFPLLSPMLANDVRFIDKSNGLL